MEIVAKSIARRTNMARRADLENRLSIASYTVGGCSEKTGAIAKQLSLGQP